MDDEYLFSGTALCGNSLEARPVTIVVKNGMIQSVEDETRVPDQWICPAFWNAHTHLADTVAMDLPCTGSLESLVTPPDGLKHRILNTTPGERLVAGMRASVREMVRGGTAGFIDFRENGPAGVELLREACRGESISPVILGRDGGEDVADGAGISSTRDVPGYAGIAESMHAGKKLVAFHAGERDTGDIDDALECSPDLLVHCTHATPSQIRRIADDGVPVAVCTRSNFLLGAASSRARPPVNELLAAGANLRIGTDNVMFVQPDMLRELSFIHTVYQSDPLLLLQAATRGVGREADMHLIGKGKPACFTVFEVNKTNFEYSHDIAATLVKRATSSHICARIFYL